MTVASEIPGFLRELFPTAGDRVLPLFQAAAENANLLHADFYTLRDLLELSGYETEPAAHVLLLAMLLALEDGSLCLEASTPRLARRLAGLVDDTIANDLAANVVQRLANGGFPKLIDASGCTKPVILCAEKGRQYLYFQKFLRHERDLHEVLKKRLAAAPTPLGGDLPAILNEVLTKNSLQLNAGQQTALALALLRHFAIISGGPGTGKTSIVVALLRCLVRCGVPWERIGLAAPTGRAAQRLTDAVRAGLQSLAEPAALDQLQQAPAARTLHQLLRYRPTRGTFAHHAENPLPADVVVVDEVSMIGVQLMAQLFKALRPDARLVLLGDKDQLSSVDPGAVLANLVPSGMQPSFSAATGRELARVLPNLTFTPAPAGTAKPRLQDTLVVLKENYRSERAIQEVAAAVNAQDVNLVDRLPDMAQRSFADVGGQGGCWLLASGATVPAWRAVLRQWAEEQYLREDGYRALVEGCVVAGPDILVQKKDELDQLFRALNHSRILTLVRDGPWGCEGINRFVAQGLRPRLDPRSNTGPFAGMPVLITRNDHDRQLFNGDVGITLRATDGGYRVIFPRAEGYVAFAIDSLPAHELAFALTVHKSQGSEYDQVLLVLPPDGGRRLLTRELVYTGITRARRLAVICSTVEVLRAAISTRIERDSALLSRD